VGAIHVLVVLPASSDNFWRFRKYLLSLIYQLGEKELAATLRGFMNG
jgi:hypothetical protein